MEGTLNFEGKKYISAKNAAKKFGYTSDYIGQLCRGAKVTSRLVGRTWYVLESEISSYKKNHIPPGRPSKKVSSKNKSQIFKKDSKDLKNEKQEIQKEDIKISKTSLVEKESESFKLPKIQKEASKYSYIPEISRQHENDSKKVLYIKDDSELFPVLKKPLDLEYIKRHAFDRLEKTNSSSHKPTKFDKIAVASSLATLFLCIATFGSFEGGAFINRLKSESNGSAFKEVSLLYSPLFRDIDTSISKISEKTGVSTSQLALSVASDNNTKVVFDFVRSVGERIFGRFWNRESVIVDSDSSNTVKTIVIKENTPSVVYTNTPSQNTQPKVAYIPSFDKSYIDLLVEQKFTALKDYFLTSSIAPNVNRYYVSRQNDEIVDNVGSIASNLEDRIDSAIANISLTDLNLSTLSVSGTSIFSGNVSLNGSTTATSLSATEWLSVGTTTNHATLTVDGAFYLAQITPPGDTSNRLYNDGGDLYWNGSILAGSGVGNWSTDGTSVWRSSGNVGIGSTTPFAKFSITNTGTGPSFIVEDSVSPDSSPFIIDANGNVGVGIANPSRKLEVVSNGVNVSISDDAGDSSGYIGTVSNNHFKIISNSATRLFINKDTGNIGIGTTTPDSRLQVVNDSGASQIFVSSLTGQANGLTLKTGTSLTNATERFSIGIAAGTDNGVAGTTQLDTFLRSSQDMIFSANSGTTGHLAVLNSGNVGIGTTSPFAKLSVESTAGATQFAIGSSTATSFIVDKNGNVGVGIVVPTQALDVVGSVQASGSFFSGNGIGISPTQTTMYSGYNFGWNANATRAGSPDVNLSRGGVSKIYVGNGTSGDFTGTLIAGNIGIGTTSPWAQLSVHRNTSDTSYSPLFAVASSTASGTTTNFIVANNGNVGVGTVTPFGKLQVNNTLKISDVNAVGFLSFDNGTGNNVGIWRGAANSLSPGSYLNLNGYSGLNFMTGAAAFGSGTTRLTIDVNGLVGVASTSPWGLLSVNANGLSSGAPQFVVGSSTATNFIVANNGNVGVGVVSPGGKFHVKGANASNLIIDNDGSQYTEVSLRNNGTARAQIFWDNTSSLLNLNTQGAFPLTLGTNNSERLRIDSSGNIGIGTTSPYAKLSVVGDAAITGNVRVAGLTATGTVTFSGITGSDQCLQVDANGVVSGTGSACGSGGGGSGGGTWATTTSQVANRFVNYSLNSTDLVAIGSNSTTTAEFWFDPNTSTSYLSGNVGIGTTSPLYTLQVGAYGSSATTYVDGTIKLGQNLNLIGASNIYGYFAIGSNEDIRLTDRNGNNPRLVVTSGGNVGVGSTSPYAKLSIHANNGESNRVLFDVSSSTAAATTSLFTILNNGNVGVGVSNPTAKLDVNGSIYVRTGAVYSDSYSSYTGGSITHNIPASQYARFVLGDSSSSFQVHNSSSVALLKMEANGRLGLGSTTPWAQLSVHRNTSDSSYSPLFAIASSTASGTTTNFIVANNGNVGVGTVNPGYKLHVSGAIYASSDASQVAYYLPTNTSVRSDTVGGNAYLDLGNLNIRDGNGASGSAKLYVQGGTAIGSAYAGSAPSDGNLFVSGKTGLGSTTPWAQLSVHRNTSDSSYSPLFVVASSTASGTTTNFIVANNGNVGIGTTSPYAKLSVVGDAAITGNVRVAGLTATGTVQLSNYTSGALATDSSGNLYTFSTSTWVFASSTLLSDNNTWSARQNFNGNASTTGLTVTGSTYLATAGGNVGVGTANPSGLLHMIGNNASFIFDNTGAAASTFAQIVLRQSGVDKAYNYYDANNNIYTLRSEGGALSLRTGGNNDRLYITSTGNVGIGTTTPWGLLSVNANGLTSGAPQFVVGSSTATNFIVANNGNVGVGTTSPMAGLVINKIGTINGLNTALYLHSGSVLSPNNNGIYTLNAAGNGIVPLIQSDTSDNVMIYPGGTGVVRFGSGGANERMRLDASGNLGIGTTTPSYLLNPYSATAPQLSLSAGAGIAQWTMRNAGGNLYFATTTVAGTATTSTSAISIIGSNGNILLASGGGNVGIGTTPSNGRLQVYGNSTPSIFEEGGLIITNGSTYTDPGVGGLFVRNGATFATASGNVGIGVSAPGDKLEVSGNVFAAAFNSTSTVSRYNSLGGVFMAGNGGSAYAEVRAYSDAAGTGKILSLNSTGGNVGIGLTNPGVPLEVQGANGGFITRNSSNSNRMVARVTTSSSHGRFNIFDSSETAGIELLGSGNSYFNGGNVGIGTTTPWGLLSVNANGLSSGAPQFVVGSSTATNFIVANNGNVGVGTASPNAKLTVIGSATTNSIYLGGPTTGRFIALSMGDSASVGELVSNSTLGLSVGIFGSANRIVNITNGGMNVIVGNVGISTSTPYYSLTIASTTAPQLSLSAGAGIAQWAFRNAGGNLYFATTTVAGNATSTLAALSINGSNGALSLGTTTAGTLRVTSDGVVWADTSGGNAASSTLLSDNNTWSNTNNFTGSIGLSTTSPFARLSINNAAGEHALVIGSSTATQFIVDSMGRIGIGTSSPVATLEVRGRVGSGSADIFTIYSSDGTSRINIDQFGRMYLKNDNYLEANGVDIIAGAGSLVKWANNNAASVGVVDLGIGRNAANVLEVNNGTSGQLATLLAGKMGVGTTTPYYSLTIASTTGPQFALSDGAGITQWTMRNAGGNLYFATTTVAGTATSTLSVFNIDSNGNVNIGTTTSRAKLTVDGNVYMSFFLASSTSATSTIAGGLDVGNGSIKYDWYTGETSIPNLSIGNLNFDADAGMVNWIDMPVTSSAAAGTVMSYVAQLDGLPMLSIYGESDGAGTTRNNRVAIGTTSPYAKLSVWASSTDLTAFNVVSSASTTLFNVLGNGTVGVGTTTPAARLSVNSEAGDIFSLWVGSTTAPWLRVSNTGFGTTTLSGLNISGSATSTSNVGFNITTGCYAIGGNCLTAGTLGALSSYDAWTHPSAGQSATTSLLQFFGNASTSQFTATSSVYLATLGGNVGVGTTTPLDKLSIYGGSSSINIGGNYGSGYNGIWLNGGNNTTNFNFLSSAADTNLYINRPSGKDIFFEENGSTVNGVTFKSGGNVGIGTTTPAATLTVVRGDASGNIFAIASSSGENYFTVAQHGSYGSTSQVTVKGVANFNNDFDQAATIALKNTNTGTGVAAGYTVSAGNDFTNLGIFAAYSTNYDNPPGYERAGRIFMGQSIGSGGGLTLLGTNDMRFNVGDTSLATEKMRLTSAGNLGIGTTTPYSRLTVWGPTSGNSFEVVSSASTTNLSVSATGFGTTTVTGLNISGSATSTSNVGFNITGGCYAVNGTCIGSTAASSTLLGDFNTWSNTNNFTGSIGLSTTSPFARLSINASAGQAGLVVGSSTATSFIVDNNGNVGVGTATPAAKLDVNGRIVQRGGALSNMNNYFTTNGDLSANTSQLNPGMVVYNDNAGGVFGMDLGYSNSTYRTRMFAGSGYDIALSNVISGSPSAQSSFVDRLVVKGSNGFIGISTSTPLYNLTVASTTGPQFALSAGAGIAQWTMRNAGGNLYFATTTVAGTATTSTSALSILNSGNVGIGTSNPGFPLQVNGNAMIGATVPTYIPAAPLNLVNSAGGSMKVQMNLVNTGGGAGAGSAIDFYTYDLSGGTNPGMRIASYDNNYSADFTILTKVPGAAGNSLSERFRITNTGSVGIGTSSPTNVLGVVGNIDTTGSYRINNTIRMLASTNYTEIHDGSGNGRLHLGNANDPTNYYSNNTHIFRNGAADTEYMRINSVGRVGIGTSTPFAKLSVESTAGAPQFVVGSSTATQFIVDTNGNVGIGTASPTTPLHIQTSGSVAASINLQSTGSAGSNIRHFRNGTFLFSVGPTASSDDYIIYNDSFGANSFRIGANGNVSIAEAGGSVGIGTSSPASLLHVAGTAPTLKIDRLSGTADSQVVFSQANVLQGVMGIAGNTNGIVNGTVSGDMGVQVLAGKKILFSTDNGGTSDLMIGDGKVGVGTTTPTATLSVSGRSTIDPFVISSSTGSTMFRIDARGNMFQGTGSIHSGATNSLVLGSGAAITSAASDNAAIGYGASITQGYRNLAMSGASITGNGAYNVAIGYGTSIPNDGTSYAIAIGSGDTSGSVKSAQVNYEYGVAIGNYITSNATGAYVFGSGPTGSSRLVNSTANSILFGTNTTAPTLFVGPGRTTTTAGTVAVGTTTTSATFALQGAAGFDIFSVATSTSGKILTISSWGGFVQNISSSTAVNIQNGSGQSVFTVDTTATAANSGIDITAGGSQTGNLINLYSSGGSYLSGFTASGAMLMNISSTTAIDIQNGSNVSVFSVDTTNKWIKIATTSSPTFTADGQFTIGNSGTAASGGRIWIRSGATTFRFQSDNNTADYSEFFYQFENSEAGDVLSLATKEYIEENTNASTTLPNDTGVVRKPSSGYDERIAGVYTERGTSFNNPNDDRQNNPNFANVGMLGHVLTKVTNENGKIFAGDYITSSEKFPGYGMKATKSGQIVGVALEDFGNSTTTEEVIEGETYELSKVMVMVSPRYQTITETVLVDENGGQSLSGEEIQNQTPLVLHNQNDAGPIMQLQAAGETRMLVANNGSIKILSQINDPNELVFDISNNGSSVFAITSGGDVKLSGAIYIESDEFAGSVATNDIGLAEITFGNKLGTGKPVVQLTPEGDIPTVAQVASWKKDLAGNYIGLVIKTFGMEGQAVAANVHYAVFGKRAGYDTLGGLPILTNIDGGDTQTGGETSTTTPSATTTPDVVDEQVGEGEVVEETLDPEITLEDNPQDSNSSASTTPESLETASSTVSVDN